MLSFVGVISSVLVSSMVATVSGASVFVEMCPIGMAFPNFPASVLFRDLVDIRLGFNRKYFLGAQLDVRRPGLQVLQGVPKRNLFLSGT